MQHLAGKSSSLRSTAAILAVVGCYYAVFSYLTPLGGDCVRFIHDYDTFSEGGRRSFAVTLWRFAEYMRGFDNARLDNLLVFVFLNTMPQWVASLFLGACAAATVGCMARIAARRTDPRATLLAAFAVMLLFPWRNGGITTVNVFNLLPPSAVTLGFIITFARRRSIRRAMWVPAIALALTAGSIHEGYAAPVLGAIAVMVMLRRVKLDGPTIALTAAYAAGCAWVLTAPGMWSRAGKSPGEWSNLFGLATMTLPLLAWGVVTAVMIVTRDGRRRLSELRRDTICLSVAVMTVVALAIVLKSGYNNPRAWWIPCLFATLLTLMQAMPWLRRTSRVLWGALCLLVAAEGCAVTAVQYRSWKTHLYLTEITESSASGTVFHPYDPLSPRYTLLQTVTGLWHETLYLNSLNFCRTDRRIMAVVAPGLADIAPAQSRALNARRHPGEGFRLTDADGWQWEHNGEIVAPDSIFIFHHPGGEVYRDCAVFGEASFPGADGSMSRKPAVLQRFVTAGGDTLLWIHPVLRN